MKLIFYEINKVICKRFFISIIVFSVLLSVVALISNDNTSQSKVNQNQYIKSYSDFINEMDKRANSQAKMFGDKDSFSYKNLFKTAEDYSNLKGIKLTNAKSDSIIALGDFALTDYLLIALVFLIGVYIFTENMQNLINTTAKGRQQTALAKIVAYIILTILVSACFTIVNIIILNNKNGIDTLDAVVQSVPQFRNCTLNLNLGQYYLVYLFFKSFAFIAVASLFAIVFVCIKNSVIRYSLCIGLIAGEYLLYTIIPDNSVINLVKHINIFCFVDTQTLLSKYLNLNILEIPVNRITATIITIIVITLISIIIVLVNFTKNKFQKVNIQIKRTGVSGSSNLIKGELFKYLVCNKTAIILLLLATASVFNCFGSENYPYTSSADVAYKNHMDYLQGEITPQKEKYIENIKLHIDKLEKKLDTNISSQMYEVVSNTIENETTALERIEIQYNRIKNSEQGRFVDEKLYTQFISNEDREWLQLFLLSLLIIIAIPQLYTTEYRNKVIYLLRSNRNGKFKLFITKLGMSICVLFIMFALIYIPYIIRFINTFQTGSFQFSLNNIGAFQGVPISIISSSVLELIGYFAISLLQLSIVTFISIYGVNNLISMIISSVILLINFQLGRIFMSNWILIFAVISICIILSVVLFVIAGCKFTNYKRVRK